jgi:hypothetical protein
MVSIRVGSFAMSAFALLLVAAPALAAPFTNPLTADQVACDELQLERLAQRIVVQQPYSGFLHPSLFLWRSGPGGGSYAGLAVTEAVRGGQDNSSRFEAQLALDLVAVAEGDLLNPARGLLPRATLVRRDQNSNSVAPDSVDSLAVIMALEPIATDPFQAVIPITVNNLAPGTQGAAASGSASGRGITTDDLTSSCENLLTPFDERIFTILSRTVRVAECALLPPRSSCNPDGTAFNITLFRGADPQTYRADVYWNGDSCPDVGPCSFGVLNKVAYEFKIGWDASGKLTTGQVTVLPSCPGSALTCDYGGGYPLFVLPPLFAGHAHQGPRVVNSAPRVGNDNLQAPLRPSAAVDWSALLSGSAWN